MAAASVNLDPDPSTLAEPHIIALVYFLKVGAVILESDFIESPCKLCGRERES